MTLKRKLKKIKQTNKFIPVSMACLALVAGGSFIKKTQAVEAEKKKVAEEQLKEEQAKIEAEKNAPIIGAKKEYADKYGYDAREIMKRIETYNYSNNGEKMVFLTFDDGPSTTNTPQVLDILNKHGVKGTFFICGYSIRNDQQKEVLKRTFDEGNAIANHTFSHDMKKLYPNRSLDLDAFKKDLEENDKIFREVLGENFSTRVVRAPGGFYSWKNMEPLKKYIDENNMANIDWNALNKDAEGRKKSASELSEIAIETSKDKDIVVLLMHDTYGKEETVKSLDKVIQYYKDNGYEFKTLI